MDLLGRFIKSLAVVKVNDNQRWSEEANTNKNKFKSNKLASSLSGARINKADRYCAKIITGMLYL
jgi:hypothetical protein